MNRDTAIGAGVPGRAVRFMPTDPGSRPIILLLTLLKTPHNHHPDGTPTGSRGYPTNGRKASTPSDPTGSEAVECGYTRAPHCEGGIDDKQVPAVAHALSHPPLCGAPCSRCPLLLRQPNIALFAAPCSRECQGHSPRPHPEEVARATQPETCARVHLQSSRTSQSTPLTRSQYRRDRHTLTRSPHLRE